MVGLNQTLVYSSERIQGSGNLDKSKFGFGGWALSHQMFYDVRNGKLYSGAGELAKVNGITVGKAYAVPDSTGSKIFYFDEFGIHQQTRDALLGQVLETWTYDSLKRLAGITNQFQQTIKFDYHDDNSMDIVSAYGHRTRLAFDQAGWLASVTNPIGESYLVTANSVGYVTEFQKSNGHIARFTYDDLGFLISDTGAGGNSITLSSSTDPDTQFETVRVTTALGRTTFYQTLSLLDRQSSVRTDPNQGQEISFSTDTGPVLKNNSLGEVFQGVQAPDPRWGWTVPLFSQQRVQIVDSTINKTIREEREIQLSNSEDVLSVPLSVKVKSTLQSDPSRVFVTSFDSQNRTETSTSPLGRKVSKALNTDGNISEIKIGYLEPVLMSYDNLGRLTQMRQSDRPSTEFSYDEKGNLATVKDSLGKTSQFLYDDANRMVKKITSDGNEINFGYNSIGQVKSITPPGRTAHNFTYNTLELIGSYLPPNLQGSLAGTTLYDYNFDKQLTQILKIGALPIQMNYDAVTGQLTSMKSGEQSYQTTYKPQTDLPSQITSPSQIQLDYDYVGSLIKSLKTSGPVNSLIQFDYNVDGHVSKINLQDSSRAASSIDLKYDKDDLLVQAGELLLKRNSFKQVSETQLGKVNEKLDYNKFGELVGDSFLVDNKKIFSNSYERDNLGRINQIKERDEAIEYAYDNQGRLETVKRRGKLARTYSYDANGNRLEKKEGSRRLKAKYDDQDRLLEYGKKQYEYNLSGDLVKIIETKKDHKETFWERLLYCIRRFFDKDYHPDYQNVTRFSYDNFGSLVSVILPDGKKIEYLLDGQSRRIGKKINGKLVQAFVYQSQTQVAAELNGEGQLVRRFVYGVKLNVPDYVVEADKTYRVISNQVGTPIALVDVAQRKIEKIFNYDEFGTSEKKNKNDDSFPFGFAGGIYDADTGLVRFGVRDYDPETGRWVTKDPIGFAGGDTNLYAYTLQDPVNLIDPNGLWSLSIGIYAGYGGGITIGRNPNGRYFGSIKAGIGIGAGASWDPHGQSSDGGTCQRNISTGQFVEGGAHFGPFEAVLSTSSGFSQSKGPYYNSPSFSASVVPSTGIGIGVSGGVEVIFQ